MSPWRVYPGQPMPRTVATRWGARLLAWWHARLGMTADIYSQNAEGGWDLVVSHLIAPSVPETTQEQR